MVVVVGVGAGAGTAAAAGGGGRGGGVGNILLVVCQSIVLFTPFCVLFLVEAACFYPFFLAACPHFTSIWTGFALWNRSGGAGLRLET